MILCCGEALIDLVPEGALLRPLPGGAVFNTAVALGRQGVAVRFLWPLSTDRFGRQLRAALVAAGVDADLCPTSARPTTLALVEVRDGQPRFDFRDEGSAGRGFAIADLPALPDTVRALFIGGISLIPDGPAAAVAELVARAAGRLVMLDPNIRPGLIPDLPAHRARIVALAARADIVKLSAEDAAALWPGRAPAALAEPLLAAGAALVVITQGAEGAEAFTAAGRWHCPAPEVAVVDSIGAGDCFNAGLLAHLAACDALSRRALQSAAPDLIAGALAAGVRLASLSTTRAGADPPWAGEVAR